MLLDICLRVLVDVFPAGSLFCGSLIIDLSSRILMGGAINLLKPPLVHPYNLIK